MTTFFIAEIGVNHEGSLDIALDMVRNAKLAGANAVKFQTYKSSSLAAVKSPSYWDLESEPCSSQRELFNKHECYQMSFYEPIIKLCREIDILFLTTCFDKQLVDVFDPYLEFFKISSSDITNYDLIYHICKKNKPIVLSCGASSIEEIKSTTQFIRSNTSQHLTLLHCILNYPCPPENANLRMIHTLKQLSIADAVGYSCHVPMPDAVECLNLAVSLGASVIEKHFTQSRLRQGNDHYHALTAEDLQEFREKERSVLTMLGSGKPELEKQSLAVANARRSIYYTKELKKGHVIEEKDIICLRPVSEVPASDYFVVLGNTLLVDVQDGSPMLFSHFK